MRSRSKYVLTEPCGTTQSPSSYRILFKHEREALIEVVLIRVSYIFAYGSESA